MRKAYSTIRVGLCFWMMALAGCSFGTVDSAEENLDENGESQVIYPDNPEPTDCNPVTVCLLPDDRRVEYIEGSYEDPTLCHRIDLSPEFRCKEGMAFFSNECGCGCIRVERRPLCREPDDERVQYIDGTYEDPNICNLIDLSPSFRCPENMRFFSNECGCGCEVYPED